MNTDRSWLMRNRMNGHSAKSSPETKIAADRLQPAASSEKAYFQRSRFVKLPAAFCVALSHSNEYAPCFLVPAYAPTV
jgi:hypothetical protein